MIPVLSAAFDRVVAVGSRRRYPERLRVFREMQFWSPDRLHEWRWDRIRELLEVAYRDVPFWRRRMDALGASPTELASPAAFSQLPPLTKNDINGEGEALVSTRGSARVRRRSTGGSTGRNIRFVLDMETSDSRRAAARLTDEWEGVRPGTRILTFWGSSLETRPSLPSRVFDRLTNRRFVSAYGVGAREVREFEQTLREFRPEVILSYPSILLDTARRVGKRACRGANVRVVFTSAEELHEPDRAELQDLFGATVRNRYACREFGMIAAECPSGAGLHVSDMRVHTEFGGATSGGARELFITDLDNRTMPFLRYAIQDSAVSLDEPCSCGRSLGRFASIGGRVLDVITTPDGRSFGGTFFTLVLRPDDGSILQFQVVQDRPDHLDIRLVPGPGFGADTRSRITQRILKELGPSMGFDLREEREIAPLPSGKHRFVVGLGSRQP